MTATCVRKGTVTYPVEVIKVDRGKLFTQEKPKHKEVIANFSHLKDVTMDDVTDKPELPVHLMLGTSEYTKIKDSALGIKRLLTTSLRSSLLGVWRAGMKPVCHGEGITPPLPNNKMGSLKRLNNLVRKLEKHGKHVRGI